MLSIAIIGTRGIPNNHGGFEQLAEKLSEGLVKAGHNVTVYNSSLHPYKEKEWNGVNIVYKYDPESRIGTFGQFIYDFNCMIHSRKKNYDIILQLGYTSSSIWMFLLKNRTKIITNMDGLEWKRTKYNIVTRSFLKHAEKWATKYSDVIISDSLIIKTYIETEYKKTSIFIPYGAAIPKNNTDSILSKFILKKYFYYLIIARLEPENNIEIIINGYLISQSTEPLIIIGSTKTKFGNYLKNKYASHTVRFLDSIYNPTMLNQLRTYCKMYFHGHSVGGTNPSLLEAMACRAYIISHKNDFNFHVLNDDALYFKDEQDIGHLLTKDINNEHKNNSIENNVNKIKTIYTWENIRDLYNTIFMEVLPR